MVGIGIMGGFLIFFSFVFGVVEMMKNSGEVLVLICYLVVSLIVGFIVVEFGLMVGLKEKFKDL